MRFFIALAFLGCLLASCGVKTKQLVIEPKNDTLQFTFLYSEALKNKMLGREQIAVDQFTQCLRMKPQSSASAYQLSVISFDKEDYGKAKMYADFCLKIKPNNEWYLLLRGSIAKRLNEKEIQQNIYKKLVEANPNSLNYNYELAIINFDNKEYSEALTILLYLQEQIGVNENVSFLKNHIYYELKRFDAIQLELKTLSKAFPDSVKYSDMLAEFYLKFNQPDKALAMYKDVLEKDISNANALVGISWIYGKLERYREGYPYLLLNIENESISFVRKLKVAKLYLDAKKNKLDEDSIQAIYERMVKEKELTGEFLSKYIAYLYLRKDLSNAEKYSLLAINKFPDNYSSWDYYFNVLLTLNRPEALNKYAKKGLEYFPNHGSVYFYCGYSYFLLKDYQNAVDYLEMGVDYVVDNEELENQFYLTIAESYHNIGKHKSSDKYFDKYLANDSTNGYLMNNYAYYLVKRNINLEKALQLSRKSIEIEPFNSSFLDTYSWILFTMTKYEKALNYIQRAYKYGGNKNAVILEHYGDILNKQGNITEAIDRWKDAYKLSKSVRILKKINEAGG